PGAPPRTSTPATAPSGTSTTVHPVWPCASVQWPTDTPAGSRAPAPCCVFTLALLSLPPLAGASHGRAGGAPISRVGGCSSPPGHRNGAWGALCGVRPGGCGATPPVLTAGSSENRQVAVQFERGDLTAVLPAFFPLVAQEEVKDMLAERLGHQLAVLHHVQRLVEAVRQRLDAEDAALALGERPHVVLGLGRQFVAGLDALEAGRQDRGEGQVRVAGGVERAELDPGGVPLLRLVHRHPDQRGPVVVPPADVGGRLAAGPGGPLRRAPQALVGVHPLVAHRGDLAGVLEQAGD